jgi:hypothetical protein
MNRIVSCSVFALSLMLLGASAQAQWPNITGTWTGTVSFVSQNDGYASGPLSLHFTNQVGNLFMGFDVEPGEGGTNYITGYLLASKYVVGAFDIAVSISGTNNFPGFVASGLLRTNTQTIARMAFSVPGCDNCPNGNFSGTGTLRKKP